MAYKDKAKELAWRSAYNKRPENIEQIKKSGRDWYKKHREFRLDYAKRYRELNREELIEKSKRYRKENREKINKTYRKYRKNHPEWCREQYLKNVYGITISQFNYMMETQGFKCAICGCGDWKGRWGTPHIDHDHKTGVVRGILCHGCNLAIGAILDNPETAESMSKYLKYGGNSAGAK